MGRGILKLVVLGAVCSVSLFIAVVVEASAATEKAHGSASVAITTKPAKQPLMQGQTSSIHPAKKSAIPSANQPESGQKQVNPVAVDPKNRSPKGLPTSAQPIASEPKPVSQKIPQPTATASSSEAMQKQIKPASSEIKATSPKSALPVGTEPQPKDIQTQAKPVQADLTLARQKSPRHITVLKTETPKAVVQRSTELMYHGILESPQRYDPRRIHHIGAGAPDLHNPELTQDHFQELDRNQDGSIDPVERVFGRLDMDRDLHDRRPR
jgi:hypothetical protein